MNVNLVQIIRLPHFRILTVLLTLLCTHNPLSAQQTPGDDYATAPKSRPKHSLNLELGGRVLIISSINYEYAWKRDFSISAGFGVNAIQAGDIIRNNNGVTETGRYLEVNTALSLAGIYFVGERKHKLLLTGGITRFMSHERRVYPSEKEFSGIHQTTWNAGVGYQLTGERLYFRTTVYWLELARISRWAPDYIPWMGVTLGYTL